MGIEFWHLLVAVVAVLVPMLAGYSKIMSERGEISTRVSRLEKDIETVNARISSQKGDIAALDQKLDDLRAEVQDMRLEILREIHQIPKKE